MLVYFWTGGVLQKIIFIKMSYLSHVAGQDRMFDAIYDPLFIVSGKKDAWRANTYALSRSAPVHVLSNFDIMFSNLSNDSRCIYYRQENLLPHFRLRGGGDATDQNDNPPPKKTSVEEIIRKYRGCFFHYTAENGTIVNLQLDLPDIYVDEKKEIDEVKIKNVGCQTLYRESSAQTRPYQPEAILGPGQIEEPELLRVSKLIQGDNIPGEFEAKIVERARRRRQWEKNLPPLTTEKDFKQRDIVLEAFEWEEWLSREEEIENVQNMRLELVVRLLQKRNRCFELKSVTRIDIKTKRIQEKRSKDLEKLQRNHERDLRKLEARHRKISKKYKKANIVDEHIDHSSELYGPQIRFGVNPNRRHYTGYRKKFFNRLDNIDKKLKEQQTSLICPISKYNDLAKPKESQKEITQGFSKDSNLKKLYESLKSLRQRELPKGVPNCLTYKLKNTEEIPPTPIAIECDVNAETNYQASVYLQKIIKGRAVQNMLFKGKQVYKGLIDEMRSTTLLTAVMELFPSKSEDIKRLKVAAHKQHKHLNQILRSEKEVKQVLNEEEAKIVGMLLDFLEKDLNRLYEQRRAHALYMLAEKERKKREALEAGKRQRENLRRQEHEEIYKNLTKASRDTAIFYLENVLIEETNLKAENDAREKIKAMAKRIDLEANKNIKYKANDGFKHSWPEDDDENTIGKLVKDFVFPEVHKRLARHRMELRQRRYLLAAHKELYKHTENIFPKDNSPDGRPVIIADQILNELINKAVDSEDALTELSIPENVGHHEAMAAIRKIIKRVLPGEKKWKSSTERIISGTISELMKIAVNQNKNEIDETEIDEAEQTTTHRSDLLPEVISKISSNLWNNAFNKDKNNTNTDEILAIPPYIYVVPANYNFKYEGLKPQFRSQYASESDSDESDKMAQMISVHKRPKSA